MVALYFLINFLVLLGALGHKMFYYLTNWVLIWGMVSYCLMYLAHAINGDLDRERYEYPVNRTKKNANEMNVFAMDRLPWSFWWLITFSYEMALSINVAVGIAFWLVEMPVMGLEGYWMTLSNEKWIFMYTIHTIPQIILLTDWFHCSIRVYAWQSIFATIWMGGYIAFLFTLEKVYNVHVYVSINWTSRRSVSIGLQALWLICFWVIWGKVSSYTKSKLSLGQKE